MDDKPTRPDALAPGSRRTHRMAHEPLSVGLVTRILPEEQLMSAAWGIAGTIAANPLLSAHLVK